MSNFEETGQAELIDILAKHNYGCTSDELFKASQYYDNKEELIEDLRALVKKGDVMRKERTYHLGTVKRITMGLPVVPTSPPPNINQEIAELLKTACDTTEVKQVETKLPKVGLISIKRITVKPLPQSRSGQIADKRESVKTMLNPFKEKENERIKEILSGLDNTKPFGDLRRDLALGGSAWLFFKFQDAVFTERDLREILKISQPGAFVALKKLLDRGYIDRIASIERTLVYIWSKRFCYPFVEVKSNDVDGAFFRETPKFIKVITPAGKVVQMTSKTLQLDISQRYLVIGDEINPNDQVMKAKIFRYLTEAENNVNRLHALYDQFN